MTPSPAKVTTVTSIAKKNYDNSFTKKTFQIHPTIILFLTVMIESKFTATKKLQPFVAPVNHNTLTSAKAIQVVHTQMGNFCHGDSEKVSQLEDMGNDACLLMGYHNEVSSETLLQIILVTNNLLKCITLLLILKKPL